MEDVVRVPCRGYLRRILSGRADAPSRHDLDMYSCVITGEIILGLPFFLGGGSRSHPCPDEITDLTRVRLANAYCK